ncbi:MAG: hypothetical protein LBQ49_02755, partial [Rickettsiales bacterium]|nr:hypothetical protein [Rickettsiales bacterium]
MDVALRACLTKKLSSFFILNSSLKNGASDGSKKGINMALIQKFVKSFGRSFLHQPLPDLVETQYKSFANFLQLDTEPSARRNIGLQNAFKTMFPLKDYNGAAEIEFVEYNLDDPVYNVPECMLRNMTYAS